LTCRNFHCHFAPRTDTYKGSYYANPQYDVPTEDKKLLEEFPEACLPNIWPKEDFPALEPAFKALGQHVCAVGLLVARQCDRHVKRVLGDAYTTSMEKTIGESRVTKGRLLHYFPIKVRARCASLSCP
jgi:hypothetical protein